MNLIIHFDGSCEKNPGGRMGFGWQATVGGEVFGEGFGEVPADEFAVHERTCNTAEYHGVIEAMRWVADGGVRWDTITVRGDSKLALAGASGRGRMRKPHLIRLANECRRVLEGCRRRRVVWEWVPRDENATADELSTRYRRRANKVTAEDGENDQPGGRIVDFSQPSPYGRYHKGFR